jgi:hypothetical protein
MSLLLDQHELSAIMQGLGSFNMTGDIDEVNIGGDDHIDVQVAHAGTGGSSKIKSRPGNVQRL